jgi:hypothetical protein
MEAQDAELYTADNTQALADATGSEAVITGRPDVDQYLMTLPPEERDAAVQRIFAPLSGEELWMKRMQDATFEPTIDEFKRMREYKASKETNILEALAGGWDMFTDVMSEAGKEFVENPYDASIKLAPTIIEAAIQSGKDMYGMIAESEDPTSVLFKWKAALTGNGTDQEQYEQFLDALRFHRQSERLFNGEDTILMHQDFVNQKVKQAAVFMVDPMTFSPMGIGGFVSKGAHLVGMGEAMLRAQIKTQALKTAVYGGAIKVGLGVPLDIIGGATRSTIEYGARRTGQALEAVVGIPYAETSAMARTVGIGTASAHIAGYSVPYAGAAATAWAGGTLVESAGGVIKAIGDKYIKQRGERGVLSFAGQIIRESEIKGTGVTLSRSAKNLLRVIDKMDPIFAVSSELAEGAVHGAAIGGILGGLSAGEEGFGHGIGLGLGLGSTGAMIGKAFRVASGSQRSMQEAISAQLELNILKDINPETVKSWNSLLSHPLASPELVRFINKQIVAIHGTTDNFNLHTAWGDADYLSQIGRTEGLDGIARAMGGETVEGRLSVNEFARTDAYTIRKNSDGITEVWVNMEKIFSPSKKYKGLTVAHEFGHALFKHNVLGPHFEAQFRDMVLGIRNAEGVLVESPLIPFDKVKEFFLKYNEAFNKWYGLEKLPTTTGAIDPNNPSQLGAEFDVQVQRRQYNERYALTRSAIEKLANEKVGQKTTITEREMRELYRTAEEFGAYSFSAWMNEMPMEFFLKGGEMDGVQGILHNLRSSFADMMESRISPHEPMFDFHKITKGKEIEVGFFKKGKRVRMGSLDYFFRDMIRATASIKNKGYLDLNTADQGYLSTLMNKGLTEILTRDEKSGRTRVKTKRQIAEDNAIKGQSIARILDAMPLEEGVGGMTKNAAGNWHGNFNEAQLKALVQANVFSQEDAYRIGMFQRAHQSQKGTVPNEFKAGYWGESMGRSRTDDNDRVYGNKVAFKERTFILGHTDFEFGEDGTYKLNVRVIDTDVILARAKEVWLDKNVSDQFEDFQDMMGQFFEKYLQNLSKDPSDVLRKPTEQIFGGANGALKRDIFHQIAGFAKSIDLPYANTPAKVITRGTMSSVMDLSLNRMIGIRTTGRALRYDHQNAFWDISRNYKLDTSAFETTSTGDTVNITAKSKDVLPDENGNLIPSANVFIERTKNYDTTIAQLTQRSNEHGNIEITYDGNRFVVNREKGDFAFSEDLQKSFDAFEDFKKRTLQRKGERGAKDVDKELSRLFQDASIEIDRYYVQQGAFKDATRMTEQIAGLSRENAKLNSQIATVVEESKSNGGLHRSPKIINALKQRGISQRNLVEYSPLEQIAFELRKRFGAQDQYNQDAHLIAALEMLGLTVRGGNGTPIRIIKNPDGSPVVNRTAKRIDLLSIAEQGQPMAFAGYIAAHPAKIKETGTRTERNVEVSILSGKDVAKAEKGRNEEGRATPWKDGPEVDHPVFYGGPFRASRKLISYMSGREDPFRFAQNIFGADHNTPLPTILSLLSAKKPVLDYDYKMGNRHMVKAHNLLSKHDSIISVALGKVEDLLLDRTNGKTVTALDFADAITFIVKDKALEIGDAHISDIAKYGDIVPRQRRIGDISLDAEVVGEELQVGKSVAGKKQAPVSDDVVVLPTKFRPLRDPAKGINAWDLGGSGKGGRAVVGFDKTTGQSTRGDNVAFMKLDTEQQMAVEYARASINKSLKEVEKWLEFRDSKYFDSDITTETIYKTLEQVLVAERAAKAKIGTMLTADEYNANYGAIFQQYYEQLSGFALESRKAFWLAKHYDKLSGVFKNTLRNGSDLIDEPIIDRTFSLNRSAANEYHAEVLRKTTRSLLDVTDELERRTQAWTIERDAILQRAGVGSPRELTKRTHINDYYVQEGRLASFGEFKDPSKIEEIKAKIEQETGGLLSAEVIIRPTDSLLTKADELAAWGEIENLTPEQRAEILANHNNGNNGPNRIGARVTIVWGPESLRIREFVRSTTAQNWRSNRSASEHFDWSVDARNTELVNRMQNDPAMMEQAKQIEARFKEASEVLSGTEKSYQAKHTDLENRKDSIDTPESYETYVRNYKASVEAESSSVVERIINSNIREYSRNASATVEVMKLAYLQRVKEQTFADTYLSLMSNGDVIPILKHLEALGALDPLVSKTKNADDVLKFTARLPDGEQVSDSLGYPPKLVNAIKEGYELAKRDSANIIYKDFFKPNLPTVIREIIGTYPKGITAKQMAQELVKYNNRGIKVSNEMKYTGFGEWLAEQQRRPRVNGKDALIDPVEAMHFVDSTQLGARVERFARLNMANDSEGKKYTSRGEIDEYNVLAVKAKNERHSPANEINHVVIGNGLGRDFSTIAHARYTIRTDWDGKRYLKMEEGQANNMMAELNLAEEIIAANDLAVSKEVSDLVARYVQETRSPSGETINEMDMRNFGELFKYAGLSGYSGHGIDTYRGAFIGNRGANRTAVLISEMSRVANIANAGTGRTRRYNSGEIKLARAMTRSHADSLVSVGTSMEDSIGYGIRNYGSFIRDHIARFALPTNGVLGYFEKDGFSQLTSAPTGRKLKNIEHYNGVLSPEGRETIVKFMDETKELSNTVRSAWIQSQVLSAFSPEAFNNIYRDLYNFVVQKLEADFDIRDLSGDRIRYFAKEMTGVDKVFANSVRKHVGKVDSLEGKKILRQLLSLGKETSHIADDGVAFDVASKYNLSSEDIKTLAPALIAKTIERGSNEMYGFETLKNELAVTRWSGYGSNRGPSSTVSLGDISTSAHYRLVLLAIYNKAAKYMRVAGERLKNGDVIHETDDSVNMLTWDNADTRTKKSLWNPTVDGKSRVYQDFLQRIFRLDKGLDTEQVEKTSPYHMYIAHRNATFRVPELFDNLSGRNNPRTGQPYLYSEVQSPPSFLAPLHNKGHMAYLNDNGTMSNPVTTRDAYFSAFRNYHDFVLASPNEAMGPLFQLSRYLLSLSAERGENYGNIRNSERYIPNRALEFETGAISMERFAREQEVRLTNVNEVREFLKQYLDYMPNNDTGNATAVGDVKNIIESIIGSEGKPAQASTSKQAKSLAMLSQHLTSNLSRFDEDVLVRIRDSIIKKGLEGMSDEQAIKHVQSKIQELTNSIPLIRGERNVLFWRWMERIMAKDSSKDVTHEDIVQIAKKAVQVPHIQTKEWMKLVALTLVREANARGLDSVVFSHSHDGASTISGFDPFKAEFLYDTQFAAYATEMANENKLPLTVRRAAFDGDETNPNWVILKESRDIIARNLKDFVEFKTYRVTQRAGEGNIQWTHLKKEAADQINAYTQRTRLGEGSVVLDNSLRFNRKGTSSNNVDGAYAQNLTIDGYDGIVGNAGRITSMFQKGGDGIITALENKFQAYTLNQSVYVDSPNMSFPDTLEGFTKGFDAINRTIYRTFIKPATKNLADVSKAEIFTEVEGFVQNKGNLEKIKADYPAAYAALESLIAAREATNASIPYATSAWRNIHVFANQRGHTDLGKYRNFLLRNRGVEVDIRGVEGAEKISAGGNQLFKLDTGGTGERLNIGDWNWRNSFIGNNAASISAKGVSRIQFVHEQNEGKVIGKLRIVPRGDADISTEDGRAIEMKAYLDTANRVAYETFDNAPLDNKWRIVAREEMELRMRTLGADDYSNEPLGPEPLYSQPMATIGRPEERTAEVTAPSQERSEPMPKLSSGPEPKGNINDWTKNPLGNGTALTSTQGYFISITNRRFRLYNVNRELVGVFATEEEAKKKAEMLSRRGKK